MEAIILAGGLGTRLRQCVENVPKPLAPVCGKPFLNYILDFLYVNGISSVILSVGYMSEKIVSEIGDSYRGMAVKYSFEDSPLGTGGAVKAACSLSKEENVLVVNGDTFFDVDILKMQNEHKKIECDITVAARQMTNASRYGFIKSENNRLTGFCEKGSQGSGMINGGIYIINKNIFNNISEEKFSFEKRILEDASLNIGIFVSDGYFIDIGIPEDYEKAQSEHDKLHCERERKVVFLDRDGTINLDTVHTHKTSDLHFLEGAEKAIAEFKKKGFLVIVITNQAGIAKGYYKEQDVDTFHSHMNKMLLHDEGVLIDAFYYCPHHPTKAVDDKYKKDCDCRKPKPGMILNAISDFKKLGININTEKSFLAGDKLTDISAAKNAGIGTAVLVCHNDTLDGTNDITPDMHLESIFELSKVI